MRQRTSTASILGAAIMLVVLRASPAGSTPEQITPAKAVDGKNWGYTISREDLLAESGWAGPGSGIPAPLPMERAVEISRNELRRYYPDVTNWVVQKASLDSACCPKRWFWVIGWLPPGTSAPNLEVPVFMSGRAVQLGRRIVVSENTAPDAASPSNIAVNPTHSVVTARAYSGTRRAAGRAGYHAR